MNPYFILKRMLKTSKVLIKKRVYFVTNNNKNNNNKQRKTGGKKNQHFDCLMRFVIIMCKLFILS